MITSPGFDTPLQYDLNLLFQASNLILECPITADLLPNTLRKSLCCPLTAFPCTPYTQLPASGSSRVPGKAGRAQALSVRGNARGGTLHGAEAEPPGGGAASGARTRHGSAQHAASQRSSAGARALPTRPAGASALTDLDAALVPDLQRLLPASK